MSDKPTLKLVRCYRGMAFDRLSSVMARRDGTFKRIDRGSLRGCFRTCQTRALGRDSRSIFWFGHEYVLELLVCIRVRL